MKRSELRGKNRATHRHTEIYTHIHKFNQIPQNTNAHMCRYMHVQYTDSQILTTHANFTLIPTSNVRKAHIRPQNTHPHTTQNKSIPLINTCLNEPISLSGPSFGAVYQRHNHPAQPRPSNNIMRPYISRSAIQALI